LKEFGLVLLGAALLTAALTYPIVFELGHVGRVDNGDGKLSIWNVAWVARDAGVGSAARLRREHLLSASRHAGVLREQPGRRGAWRVPVYWATRNPYAALNFAMLLGFTLSGAGMYLPGPGT